MGAEDILFLYGARIVHYLKVNLRQDVRDAGRKGREGNGAGGTAHVSMTRPIKNRSNRRRRSRSVWGS
eukprot:398393-Prymnesium_polylepis.1